MERDDSDASLVSEAQGGDLDAFGVLVGQHTTSAYRVALRMLGDVEDAQDTVQDAFLEAWQSLGSFRGESAFSTWMYRIVMHRCFRVLRRRRPVEPLPDLLESRAPGPERVAEARTQLTQLREVLRRLTPEQRAVLVLRELEGCSHEEIGEILGVTVSAVKSRLHRARVEVIQAMRAWA